MKIIKKEKWRFGDGFVFYLENGKELSVYFDVNDGKWKAYFLAESDELDIDDEWYAINDIKVVSKESGLSEKELEVLIEEIRGDEDVKLKIAELTKSSEEFRDKYGIKY